jgi:hypothetical protein
MFDGFRGFDSIREAWASSPGLQRFVYICVGILVALAVLSIGPCLG